MITIHCFCRPRLRFVEGQVFGEIEVDPKDLFDSIIVNTSLRYDCPERKSVLKLIANAVNRRVLEKEDSNIILIDGTVIKTSTLLITLHDAMSIIDDYLSIYSVPDDARKRDKQCIEDYYKIRDYVYRCDDCKSIGDTANVVFE